MFSCFLFTSDVKFFPPFCVCWELTAFSPCEHALCKMLGNMQIPQYCYLIFNDLQHYRKYCMLHIHTESAHMYIFLFVYSFSYIFKQFRNYCQMLVYPAFWICTCKRLYGPSSLQVSFHWYCVVLFCDWVFLLYLELVL